MDDPCSLTTSQVLRVAPWLPSSRVWKTVVVVRFTGRLSRKLLVVAEVLDREVVVSTIRRKRMPLMMMTGEDMENGTQANSAVGGVL